MEALWLPAGSGDGITELHRHTVTIGRPKDFFRTHPDPAFRRTTEIYQVGYALDPDCAKLPGFNDLVLAAFGERGIIGDSSHPIYRDLFGLSGEHDDDL